MEPKQVFILVEKAGLESVSRFVLTDYLVAAARLLEHFEFELMLIILQQNHCCRSGSVLNQRRFLRRRQPSS